MSFSYFEVFETIDRYKIFKIQVSNKQVGELLEKLKSLNINTLNVGYEISSFINNLEDYKYLAIDVFDYITKLMDNTRSKPQEANNHIIAIYNLGVLLEPALELNISQFLKEYSKSTVVIIIWEDEADDFGRLNWSTQKDNIFLDFTEINIKELHYAI